MFSSSCPYGVVYVLDDGGQADLPQPKLRPNRDMVVHRSSQEVDIVHDHHLDRRILAAGWQESVQRGPVGGTC